MGFSAQGTARSQVLDWFKSESEVPLSWVVASVVYGVVNCVILFLLSWFVPAVGFTQIYPSTCILDQCKDRNT